MKWHRSGPGEYLSDGGRFTIIRDPSPWGYVSWELYDETEPLFRQRIYDEPFRTYGNAKKAAEQWVEQEK